MIVVAVVPSVSRSTLNMINTSIPHGWERSIRSGGARGARAARRILWLKGEAAESGAWLTCGAQTIKMMGRPRRALPHS